MPVRCQTELHRAMLYPQLHKKNIYDNNKDLERLMEFRVFTVKLVVLFFCTPIYE